MKIELDGLYYLSTLKPRYTEVFCKMTKKGLKRGINLILVRVVPLLRCTHVDSKTLDEVFKAICCECDFFSYYRFSDDHCEVCRLCNFISKCLQSENSFEMFKTKVKINNETNELDINV